jgi:hypothetical protein
MYLLQVLTHAADLLEVPAPATVTGVRTKVALVAHASACCCCSPFLQVPILVVFDVEVPAPGAAP